MLQLEIQMSSEGWDEKKEEFIESETRILQLEHSLVSISKWESKWNKPFLSKKDLTPEETLDYIKCMAVDEYADPDIFNHITQQHVDKVEKYIAASMTATTFSEKGNNKPNREIVTSELIYYWMIALNIPVEFDKWHLNRLLTLIKVCNIKNQPPKKSSKRDIMNRNAALNAARRKQLNSRG